MGIKMAPKRVRICPGCPNNDLSLDTTPKFKFINKVPETNKVVTILNTTKNKMGGKIKSLF